MIKLKDVNNDYNDIKKWQFMTIDPATRLPLKSNKKPKIKKANL